MNDDLTTRLFDDLERRAQEQSKEDSQRNYSDSLFQTTVHLSRVDPETGYDDYDPRDAPDPEEESDLEQARRRAPIDDSPRTPIDDGKRILDFDNYPNDICFDQMGYSDLPIKSNRWSLLK